jgi:hypothetical protein
MVISPAFSLLLLPLLAAEPDEAEALFRAMEKKLADAKTLQVTFEARTSTVSHADTDKPEPKPEQIDYKGAVYLAPGNKAHIESVQVAGYGSPWGWKTVSDGSRLGVFHEKQYRGSRPPPPSITP